MGKPPILTRLTDRVRSGAKAHAAIRDTARDSPVLPISQPPLYNGGDSSIPPTSSPSTRSDNGTVESIVTEKPGANTAPHSSPPVNTTAAGAEPSPVDNSASPEKKPPWSSRMKAGTRRFGVHTRDALFHSWVNILLIFVPIGIASEVAHLNPAIVFAMNSIAIIPLAGLLSHATESVATRLGDTLGALLNVSFGNAVELIIL
jgi:Ca2+:H+ antiporter